MNSIIKNIGSWIILFCLGLGFIFAPAQAATSVSAAPSSAPAAKSLPPSSRVKAIWDYKDELGLTSAQISTIQAALKSFQEKLIKLRADLQVSELRVQDLLQKKADMKTVKVQVEKSAGIQVGMRMADIETARKIEDTLTPTQLSKWRSIQAEARKKASNQAKR